MFRSLRNLTILSLALASQFALSQTWQYKYKGSAAGGVVQQSGVTLYTAVTAGPLPLHKDATLTNSVGTATYNDVIAVQGASVSTTSSSGTVDSSASITGLQVRTTDMPAGVYLLTADAVSSETSDAAGQLAAGSSTITNLNILGNAITVTGKKNQKLTFDVTGYGTVTVILNFQSRYPDGVTLATSAIRVILPDGTNAFIARTVAGVLTP